MGKRRKKSFLKGLIVSAVAVVGLVMVLVGAFSLDWLSYKSSGLLDTTNSYMLSKLPDSDSYDLMNVFVYVTLGLSALTAVLVVLCGILRLRLDSVKMLSGVLTIIATVLLIIFTIKYTKDTGSISVDFIISLKGEFVLAAGSIVAFAGGIINGAAGLVSEK